MCPSKTDGALSVGRFQGIQSQLTCLTTRCHQTKQGIRRRDAVCVTRDRSSRKQKIKETQKKIRACTSTIKSVLAGQERSDR